MAKKKASARRRQQALKNARRDGRVTGAEAKKLKNLGVSKKKITNTQRGKVKVSSAASRQTSKPTSASTRTPQTPARSNARPTPSRSNRTGASTPNYAGSGKQKDSGNKFLSGKQANQLTKLLKNPELLPATTTTDPEGNVTTTPGDINFEALSNERLVKRGLRGLSKSGKNINDFNSQGDIQKLLAYAKPLASKSSDNGLSQFGARASGKISDIRDALGIDRQTALDIRDAFANKKIETTDPQYERLLGRIERGLDNGKGEFAVPQLNRTFVGANRGDLDVVNTNQYKRQLKRQDRQNRRGYQDVNKSFGDIDVASILERMGITGPQDRPEINQDLKETNNEYGADTAAVNQSYQDLIDSLSLQNDELGSINDQFAATNNYLTSELSTANAAVEEANRRANNLKTAFTPGANPNAMSILAGDFRRSRRRREDNALSDLTVLTDLGTNKNQLSGLQLA
tara:strand:+ start:203 stop:1576 length:1374 start_codon:yes stop_codon:yes gene_type:complete